MKRAPLSPDLQDVRKHLLNLVPLLEKQPDWYASVYFERKIAKTFMANLKQTNVSDQVVMGAVLRIYNGYTLFEQATDELDAPALNRLAEEFATRVKATPIPPGAEQRPYAAPDWKTRLQAKLETEITCQIPKGVSAQTPVHFGIAFEKDPVAPTTEMRLQGLKKIVERCVVLAVEEGILPEDLSYAMARQSFSIEEAIFIDRQTNLSQTLYRLSLTMITMSGSDRTVHRLGGLGGLETLDLGDHDLRAMVHDLRLLKTAERLEPGKYRVVFGPSLTGVLAHEAFGHAQEGDTCARGRSKAWDLHHTGERVGNVEATILNNPASFKNGAQAFAAWGSYFFDEEGWLAQEQVLLDRGVLRSPMTSLTSAIRLGIPRTANGKRESWTQGVYTRQTNTYFSAGNRTLSQLMQELGDGFLALEAAGGMEDPKGMGIQVGIQYLREVKGGKITGRVFKGPAGGDIQLTGYTPDVLNAIVAKSKIEFESDAPDTAVHPFNDVGGCGKYHKEFVNAGCGGPYMLLDPVMLG